MITGGRSGAGGRALAAHVANAETNEVVRPGESRGLFSDDIKEQVLEVSQLANSAGHKRPVYHVHLNWPEDQHMTEGMRADFWHRFETEFGLENAPFASQIHVKNGREHEHRQYSLLRDDGHLVSMKQDFARREKLCRSFEFDHGHELVKGKHNKAVIAALRADGRPDVADAMADLAKGPPGQSNLSPRQRQQMERTGIDPRQVGLAALAAFKASDSPRAFQAALADKGLILAEGDRGAVLVDASGSTHSLTRSIGTASKSEDGVRIRAAEVHARVDGLDLPTVEQVRADLNAADAPGQPQADQQPDQGRIIGLGGGGPSLEGRQLQAGVVTAEDATDRMQQIASGLEQQVKAGAEQDQKIAAATKKKISQAQEIADATARTIEQTRRQRMESELVQKPRSEGHAKPEAVRNQSPLSRIEQRAAPAVAGTFGNARRQRGQAPSHPRRGGIHHGQSDNDPRTSRRSGPDFARNLAADRAINKQLNSPRFSGSFDRIKAAQNRLDAAINKQPQPVRKPPTITPAGKIFQDELARLKDPSRAVLSTARQGYNLKQIAHGLHTVWQGMPQADREQMVKDTIKKALERLKAEREARERLERLQPGTKPGRSPSPTIRR
ncbi:MULTISPECIES: hypothetical protein [Thalassospira]|uniref:relaxase/mobilization nuclease domain-containing protein n=1 Tax=Thalassospira TaxID=168934 RepID=UPI0008DC70EE|nr:MULTISPECIES: hypothetical protein [Thalassospira]MDM7975398.1 hypothetical protein [Thalassospira xiamenensis]OHZ00833.1 hypothetical protein BC440_08235 [Thalassospira sp. MIT1004]